MLSVARRFAHFWERGCFESLSVECSPRGNHAGDGRGRQLLRNRGPATATNSAGGAPPMVRPALATLALIATEVAISLKELGSSVKADGAGWRTITASSAQA